MARRSSSGSGDGDRGDEDDIKAHIANTYGNLRKTLSGIALLFPLLLLAVGEHWYGIPPQDSLSTYYVAAPPAEAVEKGGALKQAVARSGLPGSEWLITFLREAQTPAPMRTWFVGALFVLGISLIAYEGIGHWENWLLNLAGLFGLGVALFPVGCEECRPLFVVAGQNVSAHTLSAVTAFACLVAVPLLAAAAVHRGRRPADSAPGFERLYLAAAGIMILFPAAAFVFTSLFGWQSRLIFWLETLGLWAFSFFWFVKGADLQTAGGQSKSRLTKRAEQLLGLRPPAPPRSGDLENARTSPEMGRAGAAAPEGASLAAREVT